MIVATGVHALLLKFLHKNSPHNVQTNGGGIKGFLKNVKKKTALFLHDGFPLNVFFHKLTINSRPHPQIFLPICVTCSIFSMME